MHSALRFGSSQQQKSQNTGKSALRCLHAPVALVTHRVALQNIVSTLRVAAAMPADLHLLQASRYGCAVCTVQDSDLKHVSKGREATDVGPHARGTDVWVAVCTEASTHAAGLAYVCLASRLAEQPVDVDRESRASSAMLSLLRLLRVPLLLA